MTISFSLPCVSVSASSKLLMMAADKLRHSKWLSMHDMKTELNKPGPSVDTNKRYTHVHTCTATRIH